MSKSKRSRKSEASPDKKTEFEKYQKGRVVHLYPKPPEREDWEARAADKGVPLATYLREVINTYPGLEKKLEEFSKESRKENAKVFEELRELEQELRERDQELRLCKRKTKAQTLLHNFIELEIIDQGIRDRIHGFMRKEQRFTIEDLMKKLGFEKSERVMNTLYIYLTLLEKTGAIKREGKEYMNEPTTERDLIDFYEEIVRWDE
ncbi:MAG: hypothetical protein PHZ19_01675 [Candidatus Thermoplasmatota archaeon]|nr:hypothetical protein [Candidatus Thermoplasmatota archaeon]